MTRGLVLWNDFTVQFLQELQLMSSVQVRDFWGTATDRTRCYLTPDCGILPKIAKRMGMRFAWEHMRIDGELCREDGFPEIFVEVENDAVTIADSELEKLCYVRAPLKLLITVMKWPNEVLKSRWLQDVKDCQQNWFPESTDVVYGFIIGEAKWEKTDSGQRLGLTFHLFAASPDGNIVDERPSEVVSWFSELLPAP